MRSNLLVGISSVVAAVALAGSANAAIVSHLNLNQVWNGTSTDTNRRLNITSGNDGTGTIVSWLNFNFSGGSNVLGGKMDGSTLGTAQAMTSDQIGAVTRIFSYGAAVGPISTSYGGIEGTAPNYFQPGTLSTAINLSGSTGYLGFAMFAADDDTFAISNVRYGWIQFTGNVGAGGTIVGWAYDTTGATIAAGMIPAPGAIALLGAASLVGGRRRKV
jgi:hypothetical protein